MSRIENKMFDCVFTTGRLKTPRDGNDDDTKVREGRREKLFLFMPSASLISDRVSGKF